MVERKLRAYFGFFPRWTILVILVGLLLGLCINGIAPGGYFPDAFRSRVHAIFADELGVDKFKLEGYMRFSIFLCMCPLPLILVGVGGVELWKHWRGRAQKDMQADALIAQRLAGLSGELERRLGLAPLGGEDQVLLFWAPRAEDRQLVHPLSREKRKEVKTVPGRVTLGRDKLVRCARLDVLVLERRRTSLYLLDGFFDVVTGQFSGEHWAGYRLQDVQRIKEDPDHGRIMLLMADGWQYSINLLMGKEKERIFQPAGYPLLLASEAGEKLRGFLGDVSK